MLKTDAGPSLRAAVSSRAGDPSDRTAAPIQRRDPGDVTAATLHRVIFGEHERPFLSLRVKGQGHDDDNVDEETETPSDSGGTASFALCVTTRRAFILTKIESVRLFLLLFLHVIRRVIQMRPAK